MNSKRLQFLSEHFRSQGFLHAAKISFRRIFFPSRCYKILFALDEPKPNENAVITSANHVFRFATVDELKMFSKVKDFDIHDFDIERVERGSARCMLQLDKENLVGYSWIWRNNLAHIDDGFHINLPNDTIYNFKGYTSPEYRGDGFQALRHLKLLENLKDSGVNRLFGFVDQYNLRSLNGVKKSGYKRVGEMVIDRGSEDVRMSLHLKNYFWSREART